MLSWSSDTTCSHCSMLMPDSGGRKTKKHRLRHRHSTIHNFIVWFFNAYLKDHTHTTCHSNFRAGLIKLLNRHILHELSFILTKYAACFKHSYFSSLLDSPKSAMYFLTLLIFVTVTDSQRLPMCFPITIKAMFV